MVLSYDVDSKRDPRMRKMALKYLRPIHRSIFEGDITESILRRMKQEISVILDPTTDSVAIYCYPTPQQVTRLQLGLCSDESAFY